MLKVNAISTGYGPVQVLFDVSFEARPGEVLCLMGRNGAGKTTTLKAIMGLLPLQGGSVHLDKTCLSDIPAHKVPGHGVGYIPQGRRLFTEMTVAENIEIGLMAGGKGEATRARVLKMFPRLGERLAQRAENPVGRRTADAGPPRARFAWTPKCCCWTNPPKACNPR